MTGINEITLEDFAHSFGTTVEDISGDCQRLIAGFAFEKYKVLKGKKQNAVILGVIKKIVADQQVIGAPGRQDIWQGGWTETLNDFIKSGYDLNKLTPKFIRPGQVVRFNQDYVLPANSNFELDYFKIFRQWLFNKYLGDFDTIYEFGCGTGFNLVALAQLYPEKELHGLDFVPSSRDLVNKIGEIYGWNMTGHLFDMLSPDVDFKIKSNSAVFTIGAIEQLASKFEAFLQFLLQASPGICVHVEPTIELYDENNLIDYLAIQFHKKRGYTEGYLPRLRELEAQGKIEILKVQRLFFGSLYMEGYTYIIWRTK